MRYARAVKPRSTVARAMLQRRARETVALLGPRHAITVTLHVHDSVIILRSMTFVDGDYLKFEVDL